jgi:hypothetical protein
MNSAGFAKLLNEIKERRQVLEGEALTRDQKNQLMLELFKLEDAIENARLERR